MTPSRFVAAGFGSGFFPWAPGTAGSVAGAAMGAAFLHAGRGWLAAGAAIFALVGFIAIPAAIEPAERDADPSWVVIDEIAGQCIALLALPRPTWLGVALAFALFRLFDIAKPGPVGWADRQGGTAGIMADDLIAGVAACAVTAAAHYGFPRLI